MIYAALVRRLIGRSIDKLNAGDPRPLLAMAFDDVVLRFPGDNGWARMFRPVVKGRAPHDTHRGLEECRAFAEAFVEQQIRFVVEDVLVNGPPWRTRVAIRLHDFPRRRRHRRVHEPGGRVPRAALGPAAGVGGLRGHRADRRLGRPSRAGRPGA